MIALVIDFTGRAHLHAWPLKSHWDLAPEVSFVSIPSSIEDLEHAKLSSFDCHPGGIFFLLVTPDLASHLSLGPTLLDLIEAETDRRYHFIGRLQVDGVGFTALAYQIPVQI